MAETNRLCEDSFVLVKSRRKHKGINKQKSKPIISIDSIQQGKDAEDHLIK